jgi:hypothetical protein
VDPQWAVRRAAAEIDVDVVLHPAPARLVDHLVPGHLHPGHVLYLVQLQERTILVTALGGAVADPSASVEVEEAALTVALASIDVQRPVGNHTNRTVPDICIQQPNA